MSIPVITFFNNKGGVGKTSMVYHLSYMFAERGLRILAADLDPQCNLTAAFLDEDRLEEILGGTNTVLTIFGAVRPIQRGIGDISEPHKESISDRLTLIPGDMGLSMFEDDLSQSWPNCLAADERAERAFRVTSAFWRILQRSAEQEKSDAILIDLGPNLGATNRAALIASDYVVIPLGPDLFSIQGLQNLGPTLRRWRGEWAERLRRRPGEDLPLPSGTIAPVGYMVLRHSIRLDRPVKAFEKWMARIPGTYAKAVLDKEPTEGLTLDTDPNCIAKLKDYRSLMPLAQEARKPMFFLKPADGALGAHTYAVQEAYGDFLGVAKEIASRTGIRCGTL